jgi:hypothetical protein
MRSRRTQSADRGQSARSTAMDRGKGSEPSPDSTQPHGRDVGPGSVELAECRGHGQNSKEQELYIQSVLDTRTVTVSGRAKSEGQGGQSTTLCSTMGGSCLGIALSTTYETERRLVRWVQRWVNWKFSRMLLILLTNWRERRPTSRMNVGHLCQIVPPPCAPKKIRF